MRVDPATVARIRRGCRRRVGGSSAPFLPCEPARVKTMGKRRDGGDHCGGELVLRHPWSSGGHPWRRRHQACLSPSFHFHLLHRRKKRPPPVVSVLNLETTRATFFIRRIQKEKKAARINNAINQLFFLILVGRCPVI
ncbi:hypothetical protein EE612_050415 [Oryza sativa]|nr:hypothetical protein EE612_050415 [Oryza sativa]